MSQKDTKQSAQEFLEKAGTVSLEYLNKFRSKVATTVVDTVYSVENITKNVIPGNAVTRDYEVTKHVGSAGPGLLWKLYSGYKKTTKQEATIFVLHKKSLEVYSKKERELIIESFKKGSTQLARLKHPRILSLQHQLEESKDSLAFATEPCFCSVANVFGNHENMPSPLSNEFINYKLYDVEIKYGLMQLAEALSFLHKDAKLMHRNISPESIIINTNGAWKLACFELSLTNSNDPNDSLKFPFKEWDAASPPILNPNLDYLAPEYSLSDKCDCSSDMFSYGMLFMSVYNNGKSLYKCNNNYTTYTSNIEELRRLKNTQLGNVPDEVKEYIKLLLHFNNELRPDASQVQKIPFFDDVAVKTLEYLDSSFQVDNLQKSIFFKSLSQIIDKLPKRVCLQRIIPCLEQEFINPDMIPFVLPNMFFIADLAEPDEFVKYILPKLKPIFQLLKPVQILIIMLKNMSLLLSKTPSTDIKEHILPMVCRSLDAESVEVVELCLSTLPTFASLIDTQSIKHLLIPRIRKLILESQTISIRVNSLVCVGKLLDNLEKWIVLDDVLPILEKVTMRESSVLMAILGIYRVTLTSPKLGITKDLLATKILPHLIPLSVDNNLNISQFNAYMQLIKDMLVQIDCEHRKKLEQIEVLDRDKSIIPYAITGGGGGGGGNTRTNEVKTNTMMDNLMNTYNAMSDDGNKKGGGVLAITDGRNNEIINNTINKPIVKKELTLKEKQEAALKIQQEQQEKNSSQIFNLNKPPIIKQQQQQPSSQNRNFSDDLLDMNLSNINKPKTNTSSASSDLSSLQFNNFNITPTSTTTIRPQQMMFNNNNSFMNTQQQPQQQQQQIRMNNSFNQPLQQQQQQLNSQMGFFGNLALTPAPAAQNNSTKPNKNAFDDLADLLG